MLCPDCRTAAPGGTTCPQCGQAVPARESFSGQGGRYLAVLTVLAAALFAGALLVRAISIRGRPGTPLFVGGGWLYVALAAPPLLVGLYYWYVLREEEITVTDEGICRRSYWGDEQLLWANVQAYRRRAYPLRHTRLGRVTWFSRFFPRGQPEPSAPSRWAGSVYELVSASDDASPGNILRLEPGTINDLAWLLELIQERIGPPQTD